MTAQIEMTADEKKQRAFESRQKGGHAAIAKVRADKELPWPKVGKKTWAQRLGKRRYDEPGMVVRFKGGK